MRVTSVFLAETATHAGERLNVTGALWDGLRASAFPAGHEVVVVVLLRVDPSDVGRSVHLDVHVTSEAGPDAGHAHVDVAINAPVQQTAVVVPVPATFPTAGRYGVALRSAVGEDALWFEVTGPETSPVAAAVEGYALGLQQRR